MKLGKQVEVSVTSLGALMRLVGLKVAQMLLRQLQPAAHAPTEAARAMERGLKAAGAGNRGWKCSQKEQTRCATKMRTINEAGKERVREC